MSSQKRKGDQFSLNPAYTLLLFLPANSLQAEYMVSQVNEREDRQWKSLGIRKNALMNDRHAQPHMTASFCELLSDTELQYKAHCSNGAVLLTRAAQSGSSFLM